MFDFEKRLVEISAQTILCVGDLMLDDFVYGDVLRISPEAPAPVIRVTREDVIVGGAGNVARNIASLGAKCLFVGVIGDDVTGEILRSELSQNKRGIASHLVVDPSPRKVAAAQTARPRIYFRRYTHRKTLALAALGGRRTCDRRPCRAGGTGAARRAPRPSRAGTAAGALSGR